MYADMPIMYESYVSHVPPEVYLHVSETFYKVMY